MPCSDSSSSISLQLDQDERFINFDYAKITCGRAIDGQTGLSKFLKGRPLDQVLNILFTDICKDLKLETEEAQFILHLEWETLRACVAHYLGIEEDLYDSDRCQITSIENTPDGFEIAMVVLPPKAMPKILPCSLGDKK